jgi:hypothetical protein
MPTYGETFMLKTVGTIALAAATLGTLASTASASDGRDRAGWRHDRPHHALRCVAEARRGGGYGAQIPGIRGVGFGRDACREALSECRRELRFLQSTGRNPFASCVVTRRG